MEVRAKIKGSKLNVKFTVLVVIFMIIPIGVFGGILFYIMEQNVIGENWNYMKYTTERRQDSITNNIDSINMSTQFFLSDETMQDILRRVKRQEEISTDSWLNLKEEEISSLERLVNNNPLLYGVRVFGVNDQLQEMMPILYGRSRMEKLAWSKAAGYEGWNYEYEDAIFDGYTLNQEQKLVSLVTNITDMDDGKIGTIEAAMTMENMFPSLYENIEGEWSCFVTAEGELCFGENQEQDSVDIMHQLSKDISEEETIQLEYQKADGRKLVVSYLYVKEMDGTLVCVKDITKGVNRVYQVRNIFVIVMLLCSVALAFLINRIVKHMLHQFYEILKSIRQVQKGNLDVVIEHCGTDEMGELGTQINKMLKRIKQLMADNLNREMLAKNSEIRALQNQINAHFIYNVLESIKMMAEIQEEYDISDAVTALGKLLRYSMKWVRSEEHTSELSHL